MIRTLTGILILVLSAANCYSQRSVKALEDNWRFTRQDDPSFAAPVFDDSGWADVTVPHDWAIAGPFDMGIDSQQVMVVEDGERVLKLRTGRTGALPWPGIGWYRRILPARETPEGKRYILEFDGAMSNAVIYVNGKRAGGWAYGYSSFGIEITGFLDYGSENTIAIRLENKPFSSRWYPGAGLYRNVRLVSVSQVHIPMWGTYITTPEISRDAAVVNIRTMVNNLSAETKALELVTDIIDRQGKPAGSVSSAGEAVGESRFEQSITIDTPRLWDLDEPHLYTAVSKLYADGKQVDVYTTTFGIRSIEFNPNRGFLLNGRQVKLKGVCQHHDLGPLGAAVSRRALERQVEILKEMGCNAIRMSHNPPAPELLDLCDRMGMMVIDESFDEWQMGKNENGYHTLFDEWAQKDMVAMLHRDRNHPCVIMWSIGNEIREQNNPNGVEVARFLTDICHREDPSRPVTAGLNNWDNAIKNGFAEVLDVFGFNYKPFAYEQVHRDFPSLPLFGSETASTVSSRGIYHLPSQEIRITDDHNLWDDYQCSSYDLVYPRWASTPDTEFEAQQDLEYVAGEFVWTGFDYLGEPTPYNNDTPARSSYFGIVDLAGMKKDRFYLYQSLWSDVAVLHLLPHWNWEGREGEKIPVHCYTNYDRVELFVNGESFGVKGKDPADRRNRFRIVWDEVIYEPGELKAVAYDGAGRKQDEKIIRTAGEPAAVTVRADRDIIDADGKDLSYVEITIVDSEGNACPLSALGLTCEVTGHGTLEAVCNGDPTSHAGFRSGSMPAFSGKSMAIIRSSGEAGEICLRVIPEKLDTVETVIKTRSPLVPHNYVPAGMEKYAYKTTAFEQLNIWVCEPVKPIGKGRNPAVVFFFGGGWTSGSVEQFEFQARHLAGRGMTAFLVEYRTKNSSGTTPFECVSDTKSAIRKIRAEAGRFGIDPSRIAAVGGSAGGHLAAAAAYVTSFDDPCDDFSVSPAPDALILFNPVVDNSAVGYGTDRLGEKWRKFSPMHNITSRNVRPTLFMVGSEDHLVPVSTAEEYAAICRGADGRCDLEIYQGATHGFFNHGRSKKGEEHYFEITLARIDDFLVSLKYLPDNSGRENEK